MQLKLLLEQTGQSWTLKSTREYVIGSGAGCDIQLPHAGVVSEKHLKFSFNQLSNAWHILDLGSGTGTLVNGQPVSDYPINAQTRVNVGGNIWLVAVPEGMAPIPSAPVYQTPQYSQPVYSQAVQPSAAMAVQMPGMNVLSWQKFVDQQAAKVEGILRLATWYCLITGFRNTPWVRKAVGSMSGGTDFNSFDGYIIPDFKGSAETVAAKVEEKLGQLRQYQDTDCYVANLTDAHIVDSSTQTFTGVELFPVVRSSVDRRGDYRRFCVVSHHRIRTYLLVEKYGPDLFVNWITRFEPQADGISIILWFALVLMVTLPLLFTSNFFFLIMPLSLWGEIYLLTPWIMHTLGILPKKANTSLIMALLIIPSLCFLSLLGGYVMARRFI